MSANLVLYRHLVMYL